MAAGPEIEQLIQLLARLPGLGPRSARRAVLHLIKKKDQLMIPLSAALDRAVDAVKVCEVCGNVDTRSPCGICADPRRNSGILIVVEDVADLWALERAGVGAVKYHVLGGVLSPLDGVGPDDLSIDELVRRAPEFTEIVLAVNATQKSVSKLRQTISLITARKKKKSPQRSVRMNQPRGCRL